MNSNHENPADKTPMEGQPTDWHALLGKSVKVKHEGHLRPRGMKAKTQTWGFLSMPEGVEDGKAPYLSSSLGLGQKMI